MAEASGGRVLVFDAHARRLLAQVPVGVGARELAVSDAALVLRGSDLVRADVGTRRLRRFPLREPGVDVVKRPDSATAFVTLPSGRLVQVDWGRARVRTLGRPVRRAAGAAFDVFAGDRLWIANPARGAVTLVDARDARVVRRLERCSGATRVALGGTAWIAASCSDGLAFWHTLRWDRRLVALGGRPAGVDVAVL